MLPDIHFFNLLEINKYSLRTKKEYALYWKKFKDIPFIRQESIDHFIEHNNNNVSRSFLKLIIELMKDHPEDFTPEENSAIHELRVRKKVIRDKQTKERIVITKEQVNLIIDNFKIEIGKLMVLLSYYCALRASEMFKLKMESFNWADWEKNPESNGYLTPLDTKGGEAEPVTIPPFLMKRINSFILSKLKEKPDTDFKELHLFNLLDWNINDKTEDTIKLKYIKDNYNKWERALKKASLKAIGYSTTSHIFRRSFATYLLEQGLDIREVQIHLRHKDISSTQIYTKISKTHLSKRIMDVLNQN